MGGICEMKAIDVCLSWKSVLQLCVSLYCLLAAY